MRTIRAHLLAPAGLQRLKNRAVLAVDRQDLARRASAASRVTRPPAITSVSLFARATVFLASSAAQVLRKPGAADDRRPARRRPRSRAATCARAVRAQSAAPCPAAAPIQSNRSAAVFVGGNTQRGRNCRACSTSRSSLPCADRATACSRPSLAAITSNALRADAPGRAEYGDVLGGSRHRPFVASGHRRIVRLEAISRDVEPAPLRLEPIVPVATRGRRTIATRAAKNDFELAR